MKSKLEELFDNDEFLGDAINFDNGIMFKDQRLAPLLTTKDRTMESKRVDVDWKNFFCRRGNSMWLGHGKSAEW